MYGENGPEDPEAPGSISLLFLMKNSKKKDEKHLLLYLFSVGKFLRKMLKDNPIREKFNGNPEEIC